MGEWERRSTSGAITVLNSSGKNGRINALDLPNNIRKNLSDTVDYAFTIVV